MNRMGGGLACDGSIATKEKAATKEEARTPQWGKASRFFSDVVFFYTCTAISFLQASIQQSFAETTTPLYFQ